MGDNKADISQPSTVGYPTPFGYVQPEDEINLADLWRVLVKRKNTLLGVTAIATIGAVLYALLATPVYRAETVFLPPTASDIQALNIDGVHKIGIKDVYTMFERNLSSRLPRQAVYNQLNLLDQFAPDRDQDTNLDVIFDEYNQGFSITTPQVKKTDTVIPIPTIRFALEWEDPVLTAEIINRVAAEAERANKSEILLNIRTSISARVLELKQEIQRLRDINLKRRLDEIERLEAADAIERKTINDKIASLRYKAQSERLDQIARLKEAAEMAHSLEIKNPIAYQLGEISEAGITNSQFLTDISDNGKQLYTHGYEAIEAELVCLSERTVDDPYIPELRGLQEKLKLLEHNRRVEQLRSRQNDDPFIESLRDKQNELARLESIHVDPASVTTARLDQAAFPPDERIEPRRKLIVALGLMLGLMLGVFAAFFVNFIANQREEQVEA